MVNEKRSSSDWTPKLVVCVGAVALHGQRALFVRQARGHPLEGQWSIPWGFVDLDEAPDSAALRETLEEGGVEAKVEGLLGIQSDQTHFSPICPVCQVHKPGHQPVE